METKEIKPMNFKAEIVNGQMIVKAIPERKSNGDLIMHVPSLSTMAKFKEQYGKRNIQQI